jgi:ABC-type glycerol-3-phosphate transport system substrate-binding protein
MPAKHFASAAATLGASLALVACGGDSNDSGASTTEQASASVALKEAGETRDALTAALATYKTGDKQAAEDQVAEAYLQHFEEVEHALEERDAALKEKLEEAINSELRDAMKAGKPAAEIEAQVDTVVADLQKAEAALR